jgi:hypothetical protein
MYAQLVFYSSSYATNSEAVDLQRTNIFLSVYTKTTKRVNAMTGIKVSITLGGRRVGWGGRRRDGKGKGERQAKKDRREEGKKDRRTEGRAGKEEERGVIPWVLWAHWGPSFSWSTYPGLQNRLGQ